MSNDVDAIQIWLSREIAAAAKIEISDIDIDVPFSNYGLNSINAVGMVGELEMWLDIDIEATAMWDYPTIRSLSEYLNECVALEGEGV